MKRIVLRREDIHKGDQILVNRNYPLRAAGLDSAKLVPIATPYTGSGTLLLEAKMANLLRELLASLGGRGDIVPVSGYRDRAEQEKIHLESLAANGRSFTERYVALPGCSEHQSGLAIDLAENAGDIDFIRPAFPYTGICGAFREKSASYGFIERYGEDKESITGISHEPWHFRYVGVPHAQLITENGLCLEEYILAYVKQFPYGGKHLEVRTAARTLEIFYLEAASDTTTLELGERDCYQISGNNVDGFIVTIWR